MFKEFMFWLNNPKGSSDGIAIAFAGAFVLVAIGVIVLAWPLLVLIPLAPPWVVGVVVLSAGLIGFLLIWNYYAKEINKDES